MTDAPLTQTLTDKALAEGHLRLDTSGKTEKIVYVAVNHAERWSDPEEKVRAEFYAELIYRYGYSPDRIGVEITVPDRPRRPRRVQRRRAQAPVRGD